MLFILRIRIFDSVTNTYANLEMKDYVKYLGSMIDSNLSWKYHIESICHKISKSIDRNYSFKNSTLCPTSCFTFSLQLINSPLLNLWYLSVGEADCLDISKKDRNSTKTGLTSYLLQEV